MISLAPSFLLSTSPLNDTVFDRLMEACGPLPNSAQLAVAVSGGPDSTALLFMLNRWLQRQNRTLLAITIDHRLRENSGAEARDVAARLAAHNIPHVILPWTHSTPPQTAVHAEARKARYELLLDACRSYGISHLFLGHHADDQAETMLMRLSKSTGIDGLAGMALIREQDGVTLMRPLLPVRKIKLIAACEAEGWEYTDDPSNAAERFARGQLRNMSQGLAQAGFTVDRLLEIAREAGSARAQLEATCNNWLKAHGSISLYGMATLAYQPWRMLDTPMRLRVLTRALMTVGGAEYPPRGASLERLAEQLMENGDSTHTLGGCIIQAEYNSIVITREAEAISDEIDLCDLTPYRRWDNRFVFSVQPRWNHDGIMLRALKNISRKILVQKGADSIAALPLKIRSTLPALFLQNELLGVPTLIPQAADLPQQALVSGRFSPASGFLIKVFRPSSFMLT